VVTVGIALTTLISLVAISLLFFRWATRPEPEALIVVWAGQNEAWDGATVSVRGGPLGSALTYVLRKDENLIVRFHVPPGAGYDVRVRDKDGRVVGERRSPGGVVLRSGMVWWPFHKPAAATQMGM
jgi:hypothetical protein